MTIQFEEQIQLTTTSCASCGVVFAIPTPLIKKLKETGSGFYCPNGHSLSYGESEAQRLQKQLDRERRTREAYQSDVRMLREQRDSAERSAAAYKGQTTKLKKRASAGVCPCCNRHFDKLQSHMETKHPKFVEEAKAIE